MKELIIFAVSMVVGYGIIFYFIDKLLTRIRKKSMERVANEMVKSGEITREEADAVIFIINYASKKK